MRGARGVSMSASATSAGAGVALDGDLGETIAPDLIRIDVDLDQLLPGGEPESLEAAAHRQHHVGGVDGRSHARVHPHRADRQRVTIVDRALPLTRGDHGCLQPLRDRGQRVGGVAEHDAPAGHDERRLRSAQRLRGPFERFEINERRLDRDRRQEVDRSRLGERLWRDLDLHRALTATRHDVKRLAHRGGNLGGIEHPPGRLGDRPHHVELVVQVVQEPEVAADPVAVDLARDQQHRRRARVRGGEPRCRVVDAHAGHDHRHSGFPSRAGVPVGHVRGGLLVAGDDVTDLGHVDERVERGHELVAGETEDHLDALRVQLTCERGTTGHRFRHAE